VVARFVFDTTTGIVLGSVVALGAGALWWALLRARRSEFKAEQPPSPSPLD
jgi:hypothetical protein